MPRRWRKSISLEMSRPLIALRYPRRLDPRSGCPNIQFVLVTFHSSPVLIRISIGTGQRERETRDVRFNKQGHGRVFLPHPVYHQGQVPQVFALRLSVNGESFLGFPPERYLSKFGSITECVRPSEAGVVVLTHLLQTICGLGYVGEVLLRTPRDIFPEVTTCEVSTENPAGRSIVTRKWLTHVATVDETPSERRVCDDLDREFPCGLEEFDRFALDVQRGGRVPDPNDGDRVDGVCSTEGRS